MSSYVDDLVNRWLNSIPGAHDAYRNQPLYHAKIMLMRKMFAAMDLAMLDEGVSVHTRQRVIRTLVYGAPDPDELTHARVDFRLSGDNLQEFSGTETAKE